MDLQTLNNDLLENKYKAVSQITTHTNKETNNIIFGILNTYVQKTKSKNKQLSLVAILNLMLDIQQQIFLIKKVEPIFVYFLREDAVQMVLIVNTIIEFRHKNNPN